MWQDNFNQAVFPKLHCVVWHIPEFVERYGSYGIFSEETFESRHNLQKGEHKNVNSMKDDGQRLDVFCRRIQAHINAKFEEAYLRLKVNITGKKRGKQQGRKQKQKTLLPSLNSDVSFADGVLYLGKEIAIEEEWEDVYRLVVEGIVPESWNYVFVKRVNIDEQAKTIARYSQNS